MDGFSAHSLLPQVRLSTGQEDPSVGQSAPGEKKIHIYYQHEHLLGLKPSIQVFPEATGTRSQVALTLQSTTALCQEAEQK